jgi:hypothetical protein
MSLVIAYLTPDFSVMSGDIRRVHAEKHDIYYDDSPKVFKINSKVSIGMTGDREISLDLIGHLKTKDLGTCTINAVSRLCKKWLLKNSEVDTMQTVLISGIADDNKITAITLRHEDHYKLHVQKSAEGNIFWRIAYANTNPVPFIEKELSELDAISPEVCKGLAKRVNESVSVLDSFVSEQSTVIVINK